MTKLLIVCCLLGILVKGTESALILDKVDCVVDLLWHNVNDGWFVTTGSYIARFFTPYDVKEKRSLSLFEPQFIAGKKSFVVDFEECDMTRRFARAYFRSMNMYDNWFLMRLTIEDLDLVVDAIDHHTGNLGLGFVTLSQFRKGLTERVFRSLPYTLIYMERMNVSRQMFKANMNMKTFVDIHTAMDYDDDGNVTKAEMATYWKDENYDKASRGRALFNKLDYNGLKYINVTHWEAVFDDLNCVRSLSDTPQKKITHAEFIQLDLIQHGDRHYPLDKRCLQSDLLK